MKNFRHGASSDPKKMKQKRPILSWQISCKTGIEGLSLIWKISRDLIFHSWAASLVKSNSTSNGASMSFIPLKFPSKIKSTRQLQNLRRMILKTLEISENKNDSMFNYEIIFIPSSTRSAFSQNIEKASLKLNQKLIVTEMTEPID